VGLAEASTSALRAERRHRRYFTTLSHHVALLRADGRPLAGGATQFISTHGKASYLEQVQGYGRSGEKTLDDGIQRHDLFDVLEPRDPALELSPFDMIKRALCSQPGLDTPGDSVESKVTTDYKSKISWNHKSSIERADEVNALVVNFLPLLATESPRTIVMAAPALKYQLIRISYALSAAGRSQTTSPSLISCLKRASSARVVSIRSPSGPGP